MKNVVFIITPAGTKLEMIKNEPLKVDNKSTDIVSKVGGSEKLHLIRKTSSSMIDVHYIEKCHIDGKKILPTEEGDGDTREVLVFTTPKTGEYSLFKTNEDTKFTFNGNYVVFNKVTANAVFL